MGARTPVPSRPRDTSPRQLRLVVGLVAGLAAVVAALACGTPAAAQETNNLREINPADGAQLETSPTQIVLSFDQEIADDTVPTIDVVCASIAQQLGLPDVDRDGLVVTVAVEAPFPATTCLMTVTLRDGLGETFFVETSSFSVLTETATTTSVAAADPNVTATTADPFIRQTANPATTGAAEAENQGSIGAAIWLGRLLSTMGILVLFGSITIISVGWPEGPEYIITVRFLRTVWAAALIGTVIYVVALAADHGGTTFGAAFNPTAWLDLTGAGWPGRGALLRLVLVVACFWVASHPERVIDPATAMWGWGIPIATVAAAAMSRVEGPVAALGYLVGVGHLLAVGVWVGGAGLVARVVLAGPGDQDLVNATRAFSKVSIPAILLASLTGIFQVWRLDGGALFSSNHGRVLLLKVIAVAVMLFVALAARQQVASRLERAHEITAPVAERFKRAFTSEFAIGVVVLAFSGWMLQLTPPRVDPLANEVYIEGMVFNHAPTGLDATVYIGPGVAGPTGLRVDVESPETGLSSLVLRFIPPEGATGAFIVEQSIPVNGGGVGTYYLDDSNGLPLNAAGAWTLELDASNVNGASVQRAQYTFTLLPADGSAPASSVSEPAPAVSVSIVEQSSTTAPFATGETSSTTSTTAPAGG